MKLKKKLEATIKKEQKEKLVKGRNGSKDDVANKTKLDVEKIKKERKELQFCRPKPNKTYGKRKLYFDESSEDKGIDEKMLCDNNTNDDNFDIFGENVEICIICDEYGNNNELWYRCVSCGKWAHSEWWL